MHAILRLRNVICSLKQNDFPAYLWTNCTDIFGIQTHWVEAMWRRGMLRLLCTLSNKISAHWNTNQDKAAKSWLKRIIIMLSRISSVKILIQLSLNDLRTYRVVITGIQITDQESFRDRCFWKHWYGPNSMYKHCKLKNYYFSRISALRFTFEQELHINHKPKPL